LGEAWIQQQKSRKASKTPRAEPSAVVTSQQLPAVPDRKQGHAMQDQSLLKLSWANCSGSIFGALRSLSLIRIVLCGEPLFPILSSTWHRLPCLTIKSQLGSLLVHVS
jgi:hypothetical protein